jgi:hypothetical protein
VVSHVEPDPSTQTRIPDPDPGFVNDLANPDRPWAIIPTSMGSLHPREPSEEDLYNDEWIFGPRRYRR